MNNGKAIVFWAKGIGFSYLTYIFKKGIPECYKSARISIKMDNPSVYKFANPLPFVNGVYGVTVDHIHDSCKYPKYISHFMSEWVVIK